MRLFSGSRYHITLHFFALLLIATCGEGILRGAESSPGASPSEAGLLPVASPSIPATESLDGNEPVMSSGEEYSLLLKSLQEEEREATDMFVFHCKHVRGITLKKVLDKFLTSGGSASESDEADMVVVSDVVSNLSVLKSIAEQVDQPVPQVLVEARIVELTIDNDYEKEVNLAYQRIPAGDRAFVQQIASAISSPAPNPRAGQGFETTLQPYMRTWNNGSNQRSVELFIRYLESRGKARILSSPNLVLRRGSDGNIITGEELPIQSQTVVSGSISTSTVFKSIGVKLKVTPVMISGSTVRLKVAPEVSTVTGFTTAANGGVSNPIIAVRNANTELEVKDGELISIGGLYKTEDREIRRKVPILGSLPVMGHLFRAEFVETKRTQLVIFLNIRILDAGKEDGTQVVSPDHIPDPVRNEMERMEKTMAPPFADLHQDIRRLRMDTGSWVRDAAPAKPDDLPITPKAP